MVVVVGEGGSEGGSEGGGNCRSGVAMGGVERCRRRLGD